MTETYEVLVRLASTNVGLAVFPLPLEAVEITLKLMDKHPGGISSSWVLTVGQMESLNLDPWTKVKVEVL